MGVKCQTRISHATRTRRPAASMTTLTTVLVTLTLLDQLCLAAKESVVIPDCFDKRCSNMVGCSIGQSCVTGDHENTLKLAAKTKDVTIEKTDDSHYHYVNLIWGPPTDGSYRDLRGFNIDVHVFIDTGISVDRCFHIDLEANWTRKYTHRESVKFFFPCLRLKKKDPTSVEISIKSLPINPSVSKSLRFEFNSKAVPDSLHWEPNLQRWADMHDDLHVLIRNPLRSATSYELKISSRDKQKLIFHQVYPAKPDPKDYGNKNKLNRPHFVIANLNKSDGYSIWIGPRYQNNSYILKTGGVLTDYFTPNFTTVTFPEKPSKGKSVLDGAVISVVLVTALLVLLALFFMALCWRLYRRPHPIRLCLFCRVCDPAPHENTRDHSKILPVYCHDDEPFVRAVESHVSLLNRCVNTMSIDHRQRKFSTCTRLCSVRPFSWARREAKSQQAIVYLSPRLAKLARLNNANDMDGVTDVDRRCHSSLLSLCQKRVAPHIVTFDCFQNADRECLRALGNLFKDRRMLEPLKAASFSSGSPKLINVDTLLVNLCPPRHCPDELPVGSQNWQEMQEAVDTEFYLGQLGSRYQEAVGVDIPADATPSELANGENSEDGFAERRVHLRPECVQFSIDTNHAYSDSWLNASSLMPEKGAIHSKENNNRNWTPPPKADPHESPGSQRNGLVLKEIRSNGVIHSDTARDSRDLTSLDSGYTSKPFTNPRFEYIKCPEKHSSLTQLSDGGLKSTSGEPAAKNNYRGLGYESDSDNNGHEGTNDKKGKSAATVNNRGLGYDSDSDNNEYEGTGNAVESEKLLYGKETGHITIIGKSPLMMKRKNGSFNPAGQARHCQIIPPRFLPKLTEGNNSISDLISGINEKTAWQ